MPRRGCHPGCPWREGLGTSRVGLSLASVPRCGAARTGAQTQTSSTGSATRLRRGARSHPGTHTFPNMRTHPGYPSTFPAIELRWSPSLTTDPPELSQGFGAVPSRPAARAALPARRRPSRHPARTRASPPAALSPPAGPAGGPPSPRRALVLTLCPDLAPKCSRHRGDTRAREPRPPRPAPHPSGSGRGRAGLLTDPGTAAATSCRGETLRYPLGTLQGHSALPGQGWAATDLPPGDRGSLAFLTGVMKGFQKLCSSFAKFNVSVTAVTAQRRASREPVQGPCSERWPPTACGEEIWALRVLTLQFWQGE